MTENNDQNLAERVTEMPDLRLLQERFAKTSALLGEAYAAVWRDVGKLYEIAAAVEHDPKLKSLLVDRVETLVPGWHGAKKSVFENLLVLAVGHDNLKDSRRPYLDILNEAVASGVPPLQGAFADWMEARHGPVLAGSNREPLTAHPIGEVIGFALNPNFVGSDMHLDYQPPWNRESSGFVVALLKVQPEGGSIVIGTTSDPHDVRGVIEALNEM